MYPTKPSLTVLVSLTTLLVACGDKGGSDDDGPGEEPGPVDADDDGYDSETDCDDDNAEVNPDATELCDGVDNDCDGDVDEEDAADAGSWYTDADGDGHGDSQSVTVACEAPSGTVADDTDCDDTNADISPAADELCATEGVDDDCDEAIDEDDAVDASTFYGDGDGDSYGAPDTAYQACDPATATDVDNDQDCDDDDAEVNPDATELCDGVDNDCDTEVDEDDAADASTWYADTDSDSYGDATTTAVACDQPSNYVSDDTDCDDDDSAIHPGADELCSTVGVDDDCDGTTDEDDATDASTWYADSDGDGYGDASATTTSCDQPSDYVSDDTDCDDTASTTYPGADELCNGADDDCDSSTTEDGLATFFDSSGSATDYSSTMTGTSSSPAAVTLSDDGELSVCDGTWYVNLTAEASVDIYGQSGVASDVVLDGAATDTVVNMITDSIDVGLTDLTIQNGAGSSTLFGSGYESGGGISCYSASADATLELDGVTVTANEVAYLGGALLAYDCDVTIMDSDLSVNTAAYAGGIMYGGGALTISHSFVDDNEATGDFGGIYLYDWSGNGVDMDMTDSSISGNIAAAAVSALAVSGSTATITGTSSGAARIVDNTEAGDYGAVYVNDGEVSFDTVDFGTTAGGDDNDPYDIYTEGSDFTYWYDDAQTVTCDEDLCGTESTETLGGTTYDSDYESFVRGNAFEAESQGTIGNFGFYMATTDGTGCDVDFFILSATDTSDSEWTVEYIETRTLTSTTVDLVESSDVGLPVEVGTYYTVGFGVDCSSTSDELLFYYDTSGATTSDMGLGTTVGRWVVASFTGYSGYGSVGDSVDSEFSSYSYRYYGSFTWSH